MTETQLVTNTIQEEKCMENIQDSTTNYRNFLNPKDGIQVPGANINFPSMEEAILEYWEKNDIFNKSNMISKDRDLFTFYDGPPFATGLPHYGHILAGTIKDVVTRFFYQLGNHVPRRFGWDCHGLPVEYEVDKMQNIKTKDDVLKIGIAKYNEICRSIVLKYTQEWEITVKRVGRWIDFVNSYKTMDKNFMESVWWGFKQLYDKGLVYRSYKVMSYSTGCTTPLSNFEANLNYKIVKDPSVIVTFPIVDDNKRWENTSLQAWTTTPWTLPSNLAICVNPTFTYVRVHDLVNDKIYIISKTRLLVEQYPEYIPSTIKKEQIKQCKANDNDGTNTKSNNSNNNTDGSLRQDSDKKVNEKYIEQLSKIKIEKKTDKYEIQDEFLGIELKGLKYEPQYKYFYDKYKNTAFCIVCDTFVTEDAGTGLVHCAPSFGEDDYKVCQINNIIRKDDDIPCPINESGLFTDIIDKFKNIYIKDADGLILNDLKEKKRVYMSKTIEHSYPFCWRSNTPQQYRIIPSWYVEVEKIKDNQINNNNQVHWVPKSIGDKRFANWLLNARDWSISRSRYWGTPIPLWISDDEKIIKVIGSIEELEKLSGKKDINDIHRHFIDDITIPDPRGDNYPPQRRIEEVFDCWFESGSMPWAQVHYPFENKENFMKSFPANFIAEGLDQTRGWYYTQLVLSTGIFNSPSYKNVIVNGQILAADNKKMSKSLKNYPDPKLIIDRYGTDSQRQYLINSPVVRAETLAFKEEGVHNVFKKVILSWWNVFRFCIENIVRYNITKDKNNKFLYDQSYIYNKDNQTNIMDRWILSLLQITIRDINNELKQYHQYTVLPYLVDYLDKLANTYVRMNRKRQKGRTSINISSLSNDDECYKSQNLLFHILYQLCIQMAPLTPFIVESMYQHMLPQLPKEDHVLSVHFQLIPEYNNEYLDTKVIKQINSQNEVIEQSRSIRDIHNISMKIPLRKILISCKDQIYVDDQKLLENYMLDEINVREVIYEVGKSTFSRLQIVPNPYIVGKKAGRKFATIRELCTKQTDDEIEEGYQRGYFILDDIKLDSNDFEKKITFTTSDNNIEIASNDNMVQGLDILQDKELLMEGIAREIVNRIQKLRKQLCLQPTDMVNVFYKILDIGTATTATTTTKAKNKDIPQQSDVLEKSREFIYNSLGYYIEPYDKSLQENLSDIGEQVQDLANQKLLVKITWKI